MTTAFLGGCLAGLAVAIPVGAVATLIVLTSASDGWRTGAAAGMGAATADGLYAAVAVFLGAALAPAISSVATPLRWLSAAALAVLGALMIRRALRTAAAPDSAPRSPGGPARAYVAVLGITVVNPTTVIYFAALVIGSPFGELGDAGSGLLFIAGALIASAGWQLLLAAIGTLLGRVVTGTNGRRWTTLTGGVIVVLLAARTAVGA